MDSSDNEDHVQNVDNEADHVVQECLRNPVIVRKILENSSSSELFKLSLVNKLWKKEARIVLGKRGHFIASVKSRNGRQPTQQVASFISDLTEMNPIPYSGISMDIFVEGQTGPFPVGAVDPVQGLVFDEPSLKIVSVRLRGTWSYNMAYQGVRLIKIVLQDSSEVLEELSLCICTEGGDFIEKFVQDISFPRLQTLKLLQHRFYGDYVWNYEQFVREMLSRAPNIKTLHINCPINLLLSILEETSVLPVYLDQVDAPFDEISENVVSKIRFENIKFVYTDPEFNLDRFNRIAPMLLQESCSTTLRYMHLDAVLALPLMSYGISLKNVKFLTIDISHQQLERTEPRVLGVVKDLDFTRIFPNLKKVDISSPSRVTQPSPDHMNRILEHATAVLREPMPDRAKNIKVLCLQDGYLSSLAVQFFLEMFPSIEELSFSGIGSYEVIWKSGLDLKKLTVEENLIGAAGNLDSVFCGIFPEEVEELREKDEDYLMRVNIVPVMPAITCLKNLRSLSVHYEHFRHDPLNVDDATFLFSQVTALIAFGRLPALAVNVNVSSRGVPPAPAITHLKPYVSVTHDDLWDWRAKIRRSEAF